MVEAYSSTGLGMALYVASMVSLRLPHLVEVRTLSMSTVLRALVAARSVSAVGEPGVKCESYYFGGVVMGSVAPSI